MQSRLGVILVAGLSVLCARANTTETSPRQPNIVFAFADDLGRYASAYADPKYAWQTLDSAAGLIDVAQVTDDLGCQTGPLMSLDVYRRFYKPHHERFIALCREFGSDRVGMITGDASVNPDAPIICCTAEILANWALRDGAATPVDVAIVDEFHYYGDPQRGWAWQVPHSTGVALARSVPCMLSCELRIAASLAWHRSQLISHDTGTTACVSATRAIPSSTLMRDRNRQHASISDFFMPRRRSRPMSSRPDRPAAAAVSRTVVLTSVPPETRSDRHAGPVARHPATGSR